MYHNLFSNILGIFKPMDFTEVKHVLVEAKQDRLQKPHHAIFIFSCLPQHNFRIVFTCLFFLAGQIYVFVNKEIFLNAFKRLNKEIVFP